MCVCVGIDWLIRNDADMKVVESESINQSLSSLHAKERGADSLAILHTPSDSTKPPRVTVPSYLTE